MSSEPHADVKPDEDEQASDETGDGAQVAEAKREAAPPPRKIKPRKKRGRPVARAAEVVVVNEASLERHSRRALATGGTLLVLGLVLLGTTPYGVTVGPSDPGTWITLAALVVLIYGVHTFGRLGPPGEVDATPAPSRSSDAPTSA
jgi:hypothetical protein